MALAGFFTRGILICRLTRPRDLIFPQLIDLTQQYLDKNFTMTQLLPLLHQLCHRFHLPRPPLHAQCRFLTFSPDAALGTDPRVETSLALTSRLSLSLVIFLPRFPVHFSFPHQRLGSNTLFSHSISLSRPCLSRLLRTSFPPLRLS